ncbi:MAG: ribonuclease P protein component [Phycisphaerales bacterium]|nr:ribonuclease P protein component [Phycisphaerales bacterium]
MVADVVPVGPARFRFTRAQRVLRKTDFDRAMREGIRVLDERLTIWGRPNGAALTRLGLTVGRRHGGAVQRNRLKRQLREAFRLVQRELPAGLDLVCQPRTGVKARLADWQDSLRRLAARIVERSRRA